MDDVAEQRFPRLAPILLIAVLVLLGLTRPGYAQGEPTNVYWLATVLISVSAVAYISWRFHGIIAAAAAVILFLRPANVRAKDVQAYIDRGCDAPLIVMLAIGIAICSRQENRRHLLWFMLALGAGIVETLGWLEIQITIGDEAALDRVRQIAIGVLLMTAGVGLLDLTNWRDRVGLLVVTIAIPVAWFAMLKSKGELTYVLEVGRWDEFLSEWRKAFDSRSWGNAAWIGFTPLLAVPLVALGLWRTHVRGWSEWRQQRLPISWLLNFAGITAIASLGARPDAAGSLALAAIGALLTVFGIADLIQALVERIELKPPIPAEPAA